jgi:hypothetical protein
MIVVGALVTAAGIVTVAGLAGLGGLAASGSTPTNPEAGPLPDGVTVVTKQVYDDAFAAFKACMNDGGASLAATHVERGVYDFSILGRDMAVYEKCYVDFAPVDFRWQIAHSYESETFDSYRACLTDRGIEPGGDADTILAQIDENGIDPGACVEGEVNGEPHRAAYDGDHRGRAGLQAATSAGPVRVSQVVRP